MSKEADIQKLRILADWFDSVGSKIDAIYGETSLCHVQDSLRQIAKDLEQSATPPVGAASWSGDYLICGSKAPGSIITCWLPMGHEKHRNGPSEWEAPPQPASATAATVAWRELRRILELPSADMPNMSLSESTAFANAIKRMDATHGRAGK